MLKQLTAVAVLSLGFSTVIVSQIETAPAGSGTSNDPYRISSLNNLYWLSQNSGCWGSYFVQTVDIDADSTVYWDSGSGFTPIGHPSTNFTGTYHGGGHVITGLVINRPAMDFVGMFCYTCGSTIDSLGLPSCSVSGYHFTGSLVGSNCDSSTISNCYATGSVNGTFYTGGLVGINEQSSTISNCYATGSVSGSSDWIGGLVGYNSLSTIINCYTTGCVSGYGVTGGLVGINDQFSTISNCYAAGRVYDAPDFTGGLVGFNMSSSTINICY